MAFTRGPTLALIVLYYISYGYGHWIYGQISYMAIDHLVLTGILDVKIVEMYKACKQDVAQEMEGN